MTILPLALNALSAGELVAGSGEGRTYFFCDTTEPRTVVLMSFPPSQWICVPSGFTLSRQPDSSASISPLYFLVCCWAGCLKKLPRLRFSPLDAGVASTVGVAAATHCDVGSSGSKASENGLFQFLNLALCGTCAASKPGIYE